MKNSQKGEAELQSKIDHAKEALNSKNGFKANVDSAVQSGIQGVKAKR
ncbi:MAG: hypothetical protein K0R69_3009 [Clostridia bacterium]|jgi:hypothetical protein|nr:hypothetical protein [Clostridia bacterium]